MEEYYGSLEIHKREIKIYRKHWQFISGTLLLLVSSLYLFFTVDEIYNKLVVLLLSIGVMFVRDSICEHYCLKIYRERRDEMAPGNGE